MMALDSRSEGRTSSALTIEIQTTVCRTSTRSAKLDVYSDRSTARGCRKELSQNDVMYSSSASLAARARRKRIREE